MLIDRRTFSVFCLPGALVVLWAATALGQVAADPAADVDGRADRGGVDRGAGAEQ